MYILISMTLIALGCLQLRFLVCLDVQVHVSVNEKKKRSLNGTMEWFMNI